jgi:hypothetical protein
MGLVGQGLRGGGCRVTCLAASDGRHVWQKVEPPEWQDTTNWDDGDWDDWYDTAESVCMVCQETLDA